MVNRASMSNAGVRIESSAGLLVQQEPLDALESEWRALLPNLWAPAPFQNPTWMRVWWDSFGHGHEQWLLSFRQGGRLRGIAPMMRTGDVISFLALTDVCDYHDFLFASGEEEACVTALLETLQAQPWNRLELEGLREGSPALALFPRMAEAHSLSVTVAPDEVSPHIPVMPTWDGYLESLSKKDRHELRRKFRRLESAGAVRVTTAFSATLATDVATFLDLLKDSREEKAAFMTPERERFFHELAVSMDKEGILKLFFLELDGQRVASAFCFDYENAYYLYNSGYDTKYASLSVGVLLKALLVKDAIEHHKREYDLLRGAETYKYHLGAQDRWLKKLTIERPSGP